MAELNWSDAQWQRVNDAVTEAFGKASVGSAFLPLYGPLAASAESVRNDLLKEDDPAKPLTVFLDADHDAANRRLVNVTVKVELSSEQVAEETLSNAMLAFRRAANILALEVDLIIFEGYRQSVSSKDSAFIHNKKVDPQMGLADLPARSNRFDNFDGRGLAVVSAVVKAIHDLEDHFHTSP